MPKGGAMSGTSAEWIFMHMKDNSLHWLKRSVIKVPLVERVNFYNVRTAMRVSKFHLQNRNLHPSDSLRQFSRYRFTENAAALECMLISRHFMSCAIQQLVALDHMASLTWFQPSTFPSVAQSQTFNNVKVVSRNMRRTHCLNLTLGSDSLPDSHLIHDAKEVLRSILPVRVGVHFPSRAWHRIKAAAQTVLLSAENKSSTRRQTLTLASSYSPYL